MIALTQRFWQGSSAPGTPPYTHYCSTYHKTLGTLSIGPWGSLCTKQEATGVCTCGLPPQILCHSTLLSDCHLSTAQALPSFCSFFIQTLDSRS